MAETKVVVLREMIKKIAKILEQEAIYFEIMESEIEFIRPE